MEAKQINIGGVQITLKDAIARGALSVLQEALNLLNGKVPAQASAQNQLADKAFVNSTVATNTAEFRGTVPSVSALPTSGIDANDYAFVVGTDSEGNIVYRRYKYNGAEWLFEFALNNSSFTAAQWAAIQSGMTVALRMKLRDLPTAEELAVLLAGKQATIEDLAVIRAGAAKGATALQQHQDISDRARTEDLLSGAVIPLLAGNLESWASRANRSVPSRFMDVVRTTAGDESIVSSAGVKLLSIVPMADFYASSLLMTGRNLLRNATAVGTGWYFLVPALPFGQLGAATKPNGLIFTGNDKSNLRPTVYFKPFASGVPTSATDGAPCPYTDATYGGKTYRCYNPTGPGYIIVSDINRASACAKVAWSYGYDDYIDVAADSDAGGSITIATAIHALHSYDLMLVAGGVADRIDYYSDTQLQWTRNCDRVKPTWTNVDNGDGTYTHFATISTMRSDGEVSCGTLNLSVSGQTVRYTDDSATATAAYVNFELATPAVGRVNVAPIAATDDMGLDVLVGATGGAYVLLQYAQGYPDSLAALVSGVFDELASVVAQAFAQIDVRVGAIEDLIRNGFTKLITDEIEIRHAIDDYSTAGTVNASGEGAPDFIPVKIGQEYFDKTNKVWYDATAFTVEGWKRRTNA